MNKQLLALALLTATFTAAAQTPQAADITGEQVREFMKTAPAGENSDRPIRVIDAGGYRIGVYGAVKLRKSPATAALHQTHVAEIYYILDGAGVLVTGGTLRQPAAPHPSAIGRWTDLGSTGIDGGVSRKLAKGDMVIIPGGTPHGWASLDSDLTYLILRPDPDGQLDLK